MNFSLLRYSSDEVYKPEFIVKKYTNNYIKVIFLNSCRQEGFEDLRFKKRKKKNLKLMNSFKTWIFYPSFKGSILKNIDFLLNLRFKRFDNNLSRAKGRVFEYCLCNDFDYFVTLTIDDSKFDRFDLKSYYNSFSQFLRDYRKKYNLDIQYLFVPERHENGAWHMHGVIKGIPENHFTINSFGYLDWLEYKNRFGFISLDKIKNREACSLYMTKYITKDLFKNKRINKNCKLYYCSRGLKTSEIVFKGNISLDLLPKPTYQNEFVKIYDLHFKDEYS